MPKYRVTPAAGSHIAGKRHNGVGSEIELTEREAAHDLRVGALVEAKPDSPAKIKPKKGGAAAK